MSAVDGNPMAGVLSEAWRMYRAHAAHLLTIAFVVYLVATIVGALVTGSLGVTGEVLALIISIIASSLLQAALVKAVEDIRDGAADLTLRKTFQAAQPVVGRVAVASVIAGIAFAVGLLLLVVPGLILLTIWAVIVPVLVLERASVSACFGRSRELVRGHGWQLFWPLVGLFLVLVVSDTVIGLILVALPDVAGRIVAGVVSGTLVAPFIALVVTLAYFRLVAVKGGPAAGAPGGGIP